MSQTETLMLIALGGSATLFVVLLFGRSVWSLLGRWSGWKEGRKVPRVLRELQAERDSLKAEKAMIAAKFDASTNDMKLRLAEQMAEVSRNRNRLLDAKGKLQQQSNEMDNLKNEISLREEKIGALNSQIAENVKAISNAWAKTAEHESDLMRAAGMHKEAISAINVREDRIRNLESEAKALREIIAAFLPGKDFSQIGVKHSPTASTPKGLLADTPENVAILPEPAANSFQARFSLGNPLVVEGTPGAPQITPVFENDEPVSVPREMAVIGPLEQGISNVLSLAERVRVLQKGMKK